MGKSMLLRKMISGQVWRSRKVISMTDRGREKETVNILGTSAQTDITACPIQENLGLLLGIAGRLRH